MTPMNGFRLRMSFTVLTTMWTSGSAPSCLDYGLSFICHTSPKNSARFWVESRTTVIDDESGAALVRASGEVVARFRQEAQMAASIGHDNICEVVDIATTQDGVTYKIAVQVPDLQESAPPAP